MISVKFFSIIKYEKKIWNKWYTKLKFITLNSNIFDLDKIW